jgi:transcriptional regulator, cro/CI family
MTYFIHNFGKNVANLRKERGLTQEELAEAIGLKKAAISKLEVGTTYPTFANLDKIAEFFKATPNQLFGTSQEIELEKAFFETDNYSDKVQKTLSEIKMIKNQYNEISNLIFSLHDLTYKKPLLDEVTGEQLYKSAKTGKLVVPEDKYIEPNSLWEKAYSQSELEKILEKKDEINELYEKLKFIKEHSK